MNRRPGTFFLLLFLLSGALACAQTSRITTVEVTASVQVSPPQISLSWLPAAYVTTLQKVYRKPKGGTAWTDLVTLSTSALNFVDNAVSVGVSYEYFVVRIFNTTDPGSASGYVNAGIRLPFQEARGRVLLLVDNTVAAGLTTELDTFVSDLVGDGWTVARQDVSRTATAIQTKAIVQSLYNTDPTHTRSLILFGHIPVPYSGNLNPDGHPDHRGAWPADAYYAEMNGTWTDSTVNTVSAFRPENQNVPGDGKFDQSGLPSDVELEVGRIDLANMPYSSPAPAEMDLLRQYLTRDHAFRFRTGNYANIPRRGLIADNFGYFGGEAFASSGWRNFTACFGSSGAIAEQPWFPTLENDAYLFAYGCGGGSYVAAGGIGSSFDFAAKKSLAVFNMLFGSYFGDWDVSDSFLRAPLASGPDSLGLVNMWAGRPHWHLYHMALGETVGYGARTTQNNGGFGTGGYVVNNSGRGVHIALMGDPTLRLHPVLPPTSLSVDSSSGNPILTWTASADTNIEGYSILRSTGLAGPFENVSGSLVVGSSFADHSGAPGQSYHYQVRAVKLETSASGTYLNGSQAVFGTGSFTTPVSREIQMTGNGHPIPNGVSAASQTTGTDFGEAEATVQSVTRTFTISNDGTALLTVAAVQLSGSGAFTVIQQPASPIPGGGLATWQIKFSPATAGLHTATVSIASDDPDESSYQFTIAGTGLPPAPEIAVTPAAIAATLPPSSASSAPLTIANTGAGALHHTITTSQSDYGFRDSNSFGGPGYAWIDIASTGNEVTSFSNPDDALSAPIPIGFSFPFYGGSFSSLRVCTNAFISFADASPLFFGPNLPSLEASGNVIAAFWNDLILDANSHIYTQRIGDLFVIQFESIPRFGATNERITCEIILRQTGEIFIQYEMVPAGFTDYSVGIQDGQRSQGVQVAYHTDYAQPQLAVRILPPNYASWLSASIASGTVAPAGSQGFNAMLNGAGLSSGRYHASLYVNSDDADEKRTVVPVELTISGPEIEVLGNGLVSPLADTTPGAVDGTDFGMAAIAGGSMSQTFTIRNSGPDPLVVSFAGISGSGFSVTTPPSGSVPGSSFTTFVITFAPSVAGPATGTVSFTTNDPDEGTYTFAVSGLGLSPIESWRLTHFSSIANSGAGADLADPDGDGLVNLAEYGFALDPKAPSTGVGATVRVNNGGYLEIQFTRNTERTDLSYTVQVSSDLVTWTPIAISSGGGATVVAGAHSVTETGAGSGRTVTVEDSQTTTSGSPRFLRVKMQRN